MKNRFIILIDFSEGSSNLLRYAYDCSRNIEAELLLVHQTTVLAPALTDYESKINITLHANKEAYQKLTALADEVLPPNFKVQYSVSESHLLQTLPRLLSPAFNDLIFVGIKKAGLLKQMFLGSMALQVIDTTNSSVMALPEEMTKFIPGKIFIAVSERHPFNILALNNLLDLAGSGIESITFFHLTKANEATLDIQRQLNDLARLFAQRFPTTTAIYEGDHSSENIKEVINNKTEELLIIQRGSRLLTDMWFRKFLINELVYEAQTPLVVLP